MRVLPFDCEASHVAMVGQPLQLFSDSVRKAHAYTDQIRRLTIARAKFAQKLSGPRRYIIAPMFAKQFITKATERRVIVDI